MEAPNLQTRYKEQAAPALMEKFQYKNAHQTPRIEKVVLNSSFGRADDRKAAASHVMDDMAVITGQRPVQTMAKISVSNFKVREGDVVGARLTLRGRRMWEFLDRFINVAIPTIRDFRGVSNKSFDGHGNYTIGIADHTIFPEIELDKVKRAMGFDVTLVTTANTDDEARELLSLLGVPFRRAPKPAEEETGTETETEAEAEAEAKAETETAA
jgi:large subunit ribosomal protein L5